jgi:dethiobiotin synthetase
VSENASDSTRLAQAGRALPATYVFREPISPHLAARRAGVTLDRARIVADARRLRDEHEVVLLETAGGLLSPLDTGFTNLDLVRDLAPETVILVATDRLGVLHDVAAALGAAQAKSLSVDAIVLSAPETADASTGTNRDELSTVFGWEVAAVFERASFDSEPSRRAAEETLAAIRC